MSICPICGKEALPRPGNKAHPFCNARCKSIDLGKWLNEDYRVPAGGLGEDGGDGDGDGGGDGGGGGGGEQAGDPAGSPSKPDMRH